MVGLAVTAHCTIFLVFSSMMKKTYHVAILKVVEVKKSQAKSEFQFFYCPGNRRPARVFMRIRPIFGDSIFPYGKDGLRGEEREIFLGFRSMYKGSGNDIFFVGQKRDADSFPGECTGKRFDGNKLHKKNARKPFSVGD